MNPLLSIAEVHPAASLTSIASPDSWLDLPGLAANGIPHFLLRYHWYKINYYGKTLNPLILNNQNLYFLYELMVRVVPLFKIAFYKLSNIAV